MYLNIYHVFIVNSQNARSILPALCSGAESHYHIRIGNIINDLKYRHRRLPGRSLDIRGITDVRALSHQPVVVCRRRSSVLRWCEPGEIHLYLFLIDRPVSSVRSGKGKIDIVLAVKLRQPLKVILVLQRVPCPSVVELGCQGSSAVPSDAVDIDILFYLVENSDLEFIRPV